MFVFCPFAFAVHSFSTTPVLRGDRRPRAAGSAALEAWRGEYGFGVGLHVVSSSKSRKRFYQMLSFVLFRSFDLRQLVHVYPRLDLRNNPLAQNIHWQRVQLYGDVSVFRYKLGRPAVGLLGEVRGQVVALNVVYRQSAFDQLRINIEELKPLAERSRHVFAARVEVSEIENRHVVQIFVPLRGVADRVPPVEASADIERDAVGT